jgi:hypothetical protein
MIGHSSLATLPLLRKYRSRRASSYDRAGNNNDWFEAAPGQTLELLNTDKPGCVKHIWMTIGRDDLFPRQCVLRAYWDGEEHPSIEVPAGDFFGIGMGIFKDFISAPLQMSPQDGRGMNCWFPMPFDSARITLESECENPINVYYYIDYEEYPAPHSPEVGRFHAQWRREAQTEGWLTERLDNENLWDIWSRKPNITGADNYVLLEAQGSGVYVGCNLNIDVFEKQGNDWYGEGDDMIFIDGEPWPPGLHGTGTEDYFNMAFCPRKEYCAPYHGLTVYSGNSDWPWSGKNSMYRFHIEDPIRFEKSIRVTIEHGHANKLSNDYSSTAYWYQTEPHAPFPTLLPVEMRKSRP